MSEKEIDLIFDTIRKHKKVLIEDIMEPPAEDKAVMSADP